MRDETTVGPSCQLDVNCHSVAVKHSENQRIRLLMGGVQEDGLFEFAFLLFRGNVGGAGSSSMAAHSSLGGYLVVASPKVCRGLHCRQSILLRLLPPEKPWLYVTCLKISVSASRAPPRCG